MVMSVNQLRSLRKCVPTLLLAAALSPAAYAKDQVPDWVREAAAIKTPTYSAKTDAVVLLHDVSYTVGTDGTLTEHVRRVVRVLRPQGRRYAEMFASFDKASKLRYVHIWSIGPDGKEYAVKDSDQKEYSTSRFELYSDGRVRGLQAPASDVGAVAAMEFERQDKPYENDIVWIPGERLPVVKERMTLNLPTGYSFTSSWKGKQTTQPVDAEHGRTFWEALNQEPLFSEDELPLAPHEIALVPRLDVFYQGPGVAGQYGAMNGSWRGVGEWYERLGKDRNKPDAMINAKAQELVQGKTEFRDRVNAIAGFVQRDIRYVAIEIGVGGEQPHAAADTFHARYGDCKDKATLLSAMLNAVGLRSTWVMWIHGAAW